MEAWKMKTFLFVNPASGHHSTQRLKTTLERLRLHAIIPEVFQVRTPAEIHAHCDTINREHGTHLVIVAGGDGTFNAVVNGLEPGSATLAVLPFGTSNVLAAEIGLTSLDHALERIIAGQTRPLSVGVIKLEGRSHRFVLMAGIGFDGVVVRDVWPLGKKLVRQGAYALSALKHAIVWDSSVVNVLTPAINVTCHSAIICNASRYGGNFILEPDSSPFSAGLTAICVTDNRRRSYIRIVSDLFRGRNKNDHTVVRLPATSFEICGTKAIQIDGDFIGYGPARFSLEPNFAQMIV